MKRSNLDQEMISSLGEEKPVRSRLDRSHLRRHDAEVLRDEQLLRSREQTVQERTLVLYRVMSVLASVGIIAILLWGVMDLPAFGRETSPTENEVAARYLENGLAEGGATNLVANMILDYRAFDTLGESNVLFAASCAVMMLLWRLDERDGHAPAAVKPPRARDPVLQTGARIFCPVIFLLGLYIILNGHLGPGGGFSGGAVMGAALILFRCAFGSERIGRFISWNVFRAVIFTALTFYALSKAYSFFTGANGLPSFITVGTPGAIFSGGLILPLNIAVGFVVCCTMYGFFVLFEFGKGEF